MCIIFLERESDENGSRRSCRDISCLNHCCIIVCEWICCTVKGNLKLVHDNLFSIVNSGSKMHYLFLGKGSLRGADLPLPPVSHNQHSLTADIYIRSQLFFQITFQCTSKKRKGEGKKMLIYIESFPVSSGDY